MQLPRVSSRLTNLPISAVRRLVPYAEQAKKEGLKVYHLNIGDPDIETPKVMLDVLKDWDIETIRYAQSTGEKTFLEAMLQYYQNLGYSASKLEDIVATVGGSEAVLMAIFAVCNKGDEILVFEPYYSNYGAIASLMDVSLKAVPTRIEDGFHLPLKKDIVKHISKKTKAILFCSPGNPTGTVYTKKEMDLLATIAKEYGLFLISDEVYREFLFDNRSHVSLFEYMNKLPKHCIVLDSLSKRYSLCGARLGTLVSKNEEVIKGAIKIAQSRLSGGFVDQIIGSKLTKVKKSYMEKIIQEYQTRRDVLYAGLMGIDGVHLAKPEGAFYTIVNLPVKNAEDFCIFLLEKFRLNNETVMLAPGNGFYAKGGKSTVRIAYVLNTKDLTRCIEIIRHALTAYLKK